MKISIILPKNFDSELYFAVQLQNMGLKKIRPVNNDGDEFKANIPANVDFVILYELLKKYDCIWSAFDGDCEWSNTFPGMMY